MNSHTSPRAIAAALRRQQREAEKRQRELERRAKDQAKLSEIERARLEVETFENRLEVLLSIHKEQGDVRDWRALAAALPSPSPVKLTQHEMRTRQHIAVDFRQQNDQDKDATLRHAKSLDEQDFQKALDTFAAAKTTWEQMKMLARDVLAGKSEAYQDVLTRFCPLAEMSDLGTAIRFTVHSPHLLECTLKVNGVQAIPSHAKALTSTGKVSVKPMPKARFHEIYQDYVCACILRTAREVLASLPVDVLLITASADVLSSSTGQTAEQPVLSVVIPRAFADQLDFDHLDPSDTIESALHRGNFKATRGSGVFQPITPLTVAEVPRSGVERMTSDELFASVRRLREDLQAERSAFNPKPPPVEIVDGSA